MQDNNSQQKPKEEFFSDFYDPEPLEKLIKTVAKTPEEHLELDTLVDEFIEIKMFAFCSSFIPEEKEKEWCDTFHDLEKSEAEILDFLDKEAGSDVRERIREIAPRWGKDLIDIIKRLAESEASIPPENKG